MKKWTLRKLRLRSVWLLVVPFVWFAEPTPLLLAVGLGLGLLGLAIRSWSAGIIRKEAELTVEGPYAHTRNPLYVGTFFLGLGVTVAGGQWYFVALFLLFYVLVYGRTIGGEAELLEELFGEEYRRYAERVPLVVPRLTPYRPEGEGSGIRFTVERWRRNREYEALLGAAVGFVVLAAKMIWLSG